MNEKPTKKHRFDPLESRRELGDIKPQTSPQAVYYWVYAEDDGSGRRALLMPPEMTYDDAVERGINKLSTPFTVVPLRTSDQTEATRQIRMIEMEHGMTLGQVLNPMRHKVKET